MLLMNFFLSAMFQGINRVSQDVWHPGQSSFKLEFNGKDASYGNPPAGSLTEARHQKACSHVNKEISQLLGIIRSIGTRDQETGKKCVTFYKLFRYYIPISDKIVGLLLRARRWRLVHFSGEMLYQGQDDDVVITLLLDEDDIPYDRKHDFVTSDNKPTGEGSYPASEASVSTSEMNNNSSHGSLLQDQGLDEMSEEEITNNGADYFVSDTNTSNDQVSFFLNHHTEHDK